MLFCKSKLIAPHHPPPVASGVGAKLTGGLLLSYEVIMNLKNRILKSFLEHDIDISKIRLKYYKQSPYQKRRYKPEFVEQECWLYPLNCCIEKTYQINGKLTKFKPCGICITETDWQDKDFRAMIIEDAKRLSKTGLLRSHRPRLRPTAWIL